MDRKTSAVNRRIVMLDTNNRNTMNYSCSYCRDKSMDDRYTMLDSRSNLYWMYLVQQVYVVFSFDAKERNEQIEKRELNFYLLDDSETNLKFESDYNLTSVQDVLFLEYQDVIAVQNSLLILHVLVVYRHVEIAKRT